MALVIGIDEAGRGPVIGPLVICGIVMEESKIDDLLSIGVKDSKLLSPYQRESLFERVKAIVKDYKIHIIPPAEIDAAVESETMNLNWLEAVHSAKIIDELAIGETAILDCPSNNIKAYTEYVRKLLAKDINLVCEHKADLNHPPVSAASILAKVVRDREIEKIQKTVGQQPMGSGYPADPYTKRFLEHNWDKYDFFRKSWASWKNCRASKAQRNLGQF